MALGKGEVVYCGQNGTYHRSSKGTATVGTVRHSTVTLGELQTGVEMIRAREPVKAADIQAWL